MHRLKVGDIAIEEKEWSGFLRALDDIDQGIAVFDGDDRLVAWNRGFEAMWDLPPTLGQVGCALAEIVRHHAVQGELGEGQPDFLAQRLIDDLRHRPGDTVEFIRTNGLVLEQRATRVPGGGLVLLYTDVTNRKRIEEKIWRQANFDTLTGLANRNLFADRLRQAAAYANRHRSCLGLIFVDLDGFKPVNDCHGHAAGDALLVEIAGRLRGCLRQTDTAARLAGDEFALILQELQDARDAGLVAAKVLREIARPVALDQVEVQVTASLGVAIYPDHTSDWGKLLFLADGAMYKAKHNGKNNFALVEPQANPSDSRKLP